MTYVPTTQDLDWTKRAIQGKHSWAVPSGGFLLTLDHDKMVFNTFMKMNPNRRELDLFARVSLNLFVLGYQEGKRVSCEGANSVDDIVMNFFGWTEDEIERNKIESLLTRPHDPRFDES